MLYKFSHKKKDFLSNEAHRKQWVGQLVGDYMIVSGSDTISPDFCLKEDSFKLQFHCVCKNRIRQRLNEDIYI